MKHPLIGSRLGKYELTSLIDSNHSHFTFDAFDLEIGEKKSIKVFKGNYVNTEKQKQQLYTSLIATSKWTHPNIIVPEEVAHEKGIFYASFSRLETTLADACQKMGVITTIKAVGFADQICAALAYAHKKKTLHMNISPFSIFIIDKQIKLIGFGFIPTIDFWMNSDILDCPFYSPPELAKNETNISSDLYSLGITLFHLLTGVLPFEGNTTEEIFQQITFSSVPTIKKYRPNISENLNVIIKKLMQKDPQERFHSAEELGKELRKISNRTGTKFENKKIQDVFLSMLIQNDTNIDIDKIINILETIANSNNASGNETLMERIAKQELSEKLNCNMQIIEGIKTDNEIMMDPRSWIKNAITQHSGNKSQNIVKNSQSRFGNRSQNIKTSSDRTSEYRQKFPKPKIQKKNKTLAQTTRIMDFEAYRESRKEHTPIRRRSQTPRPVSEIKIVVAPETPKASETPVRPISNDSIEKDNGRKWQGFTLFLITLFIVVAVFIFLSPYLQQQIKNWFE